MANEIAYIVKGFPRLSETFISNEVLLLEQSGVTIKLFSVKRPDETLQQDTVSQIKAKPVYLPAVTSVSNTFLPVWLAQNSQPFLKAHVNLAVKQPLTFFSCLFKALSMMIIYRHGLFAKPKKVFLKEFIQAVYIADQIIQSGNIRHIHSHFCHGATTIAWFVSKLTNLPFSFTAHAKDIYQKNQNPGNLLIKKIQAASFVATCTGANKCYLDQLADPQKIKLIYHGLDISFFTPEKQNSEEKIQEILSVGRFVEKKGFNYLIEACALLKIRGLQFHCCIIGEEGEAYPALKTEIEELGLDEQISLEKPKAHNELKQIYQQSDIFALPCQIVNDGDRDGIPNVLVEAMACGLAVVSTNISGIPELIKHQHNGLLVTQKNSEELADALEQLLTDQTLSVQLADKARDTVLKEFDSEKTTQYLHRLFDNCMGCDTQNSTGNEEISSANT